MDPDGEDYNPSANVPTECYIRGCTDSRADNYWSKATADDGLCAGPLRGCTQPDADNFNPTVHVDDGTCIFVGCMDPLAINYMSLALYSSGYCEFAPPSPPNPPPLPPPSLPPSPQSPQPALPPRVPLPSAPPAAPPASPPPPPRAPTVPPIPPRLPDSPPPRLPDSPPSRGLLPPQGPPPPVLPLLGGDDNIGVELGGAGWAAIAGGACAFLCCVGLGFHIFHRGKRRLKMLDVAGGGGGQVASAEGGGGGMPPAVQPDKQIPSQGGEGGRTGHKGFSRGQGPLVGV